MDPFLANKAKHTEIQMLKWSKHLTRIYLAATVFAKMGKATSYMVYEAVAQIVMQLLMFTEKLNYCVLSILQHEFRLGLR